MADVQVQLREEWVGRLNTGSVAVPVWTLIGPGFNTFDEDLGVKVEATQYISDTAQSKAVTGYAGVWAFSGDRIVTQTVIDFIVAIGTTQATSDDAESELLVYDLEAVSAIFGTVDAVKYPVVVECTSRATGAGGEKLGFNGNLHQNGDVVPGTYDTDTGVFTPDES